MSWSLRATVLMLLLTTLAGCIAGEPPADESTGTSIDHEAILSRIGDPFVIPDDHDHADLSAPGHTGGVNMEQLTWSTLDVELGKNGFANFVFYEDADEELAFVAIDGDTEGGFAIIDVSEPTNITVLGKYWVRGNSIQEVRVTPDGRYAFMNVQDLPDPQRIAAPGDCTVCLHIVDVRDRTAPTLVNVHPIEVIGTHNMDVTTIDGDVYVFYVGQPAFGTGGAALVGNYIAAARFVEGPNGPTLVKVGEWHDTRVATAPARSFPHDVMVYEHPFTGQHIAYISHWEGGAILVDASDPTQMALLDIYDDPAPSTVNNIHWFAPEPETRGDRLIAWSAPEIQQLEGSTGHMRAYDVTDPTAIEQVATWELPSAVGIDRAFVFSPHITMPDMERGLLAVSHYHAGVWILDITNVTDPQPLGYYLPNGNGTAPYDGDIWWKKPNFNPAGFTPNVYQARWKDDLLFVTERSTGFYVLEYTGPVPADAVPDWKDA